MLTAIDELGDLTQTGLRTEFDAAAPSQEEAVLEHLSGAVSEADAKLERRRAKAPEQPAEPPREIDVATQRFLADDDE